MIRERRLAEETRRPEGHFSDPPPRPREATTEAAREAGTRRQRPDTWEVRAPEGFSSRILPFPCPNHASTSPRKRSKTINSHIYWVLSMCRAHLLLTRLIPREARGRAESRNSPHVFSQALSREFEGECALKKLAGRRIFPRRRTHLAPEEGTKGREEGTRGGTVVPGAGEGWRPAPTFLLP